MSNFKKRAKLFELPHSLFSAPVLLDIFIKELYLIAMNCRLMTSLIVSRPSSCRTQPYSSAFLAWKTCWLEKKNLIIRNCLLNQVCNLVVNSQALNWSSTLIQLNIMKYPLNSLLTRKLHISRYLKSWYVCIDQYRYYLYSIVSF